MLREQRIMEKMVNELGDELNEYMNKFYLCDLWKIKEGEVIVNKTFKRIVDIIAEANLSTGDEVMKSAFKLIENNEAMMKMLEFISDDYVRNGGDSLLNKSLVFCFSLFMQMVYDKLTATDVLNNVINSEVMRTEYTLWHTIKYKLGFVERPYKIKGEPEAILLISILRGNSLPQTMRDIAEYKELV